MSPRIISLIPSATEIVCALGLGDSLVGRSHECDYPTFVQDLPICTEPKFMPDGTSIEIDQEVKSLLQRALSIYRVHEAVLEELKPDFIITQSQCEVCAVSLEDVQQAVCNLTKSNTHIVSLEPNDLSYIWKDIQSVADALGVPDRGITLTKKLQDRMQSLSEQVSKATYTPTVATIEWIEPIMAAGNWVPELIEMAGGKNLFGEAGKHSPWMKFEELEKADPDVIVVMPCGFDIDRSRKEMPAITNLKGWSGLRAVREGRVYVTEGNQYFNRPGPRVVDSLEILIEILHPSNDSDYQGKGWEYL